MGQFRLGILSALGIIGLSMQGCNSDGGTVATQRPIEPAEATTTTNERIDEVLTGLADATNEIDTAESTSIATDGLTAALGNDPCRPTNSGSVTTSASNAVDSVPDSTTNALADLLVRVRDEAKEHVFRDELVESKDGNRVVYKVNPTEACGTRTDCVDKLTKNPLRFAVTANSDDTLNVELLVGQDQHSPASAILGESKLAVRGDLAEAMDSLRLFMSASEQQDLPEKLSGTVEWSIEKRAAGEFVLTASVLEKVEMLTGQAKGKPISFTMQPSNPTTQITIDSNTNSIGFKENLGTIDVSAAGTAVCGDLKCGAKEQSGTFGLHLAGLTGEFSAVAGATELTFSGLGLGSEASYLSLNNQQLTTVNLNPTTGRKFSINFKKTAEGTLVTFEPQLDLSIAMAMANLSESMRVDMPDWLANEVFDVTLGGAPKPAVLIPAAVCDANGNSTVKQQLKVIAGNLRLDSTSLPAPVEVTAGMCLLPVDSNATEPNPMSLVGAGVCQ